MTVVSKRVMVAAGAGAVALVVLAGCTGSDPAPTVSTTSSAPTTSASPTTSATSAAPTTSATAGGIPEAAKADTPAGAQAFVTYFGARLNNAWTKPDPQFLEGLCDAASKACASYRDTAARMAAKQQRYDTPPLTIKSLSDAGEDAGARVVMAQVIVNAARIVDAAGTSVESFKRETQTYVYLTRWTGRSWVIQEVKVG